MQKLLHDNFVNVLGVLDFIIVVLLSLIVFKLIDIVGKKVISKTLKNSTSVKANNLSLIIIKILKFIVLFFAFTIVLQKHGYSLTSLIAGFGITGLAVGLAAKETISNIFGSISIIYDGIYELRDYVKFGDIEGYVEDMNFRSTKIRTLDNLLVTIPNANIATMPVVNYSKITKRRVSLTFGLVYNTALDKISLAKEIILDYIKNSSDFSDDFCVYVDELADSSINLSMFAYINHSDLKSFIKIKDSLLEYIISEFSKNQINFAYPTHSIILENK